MRVRSSGRSLLGGLGLALVVMVAACAPAITPRSSATSPGQTEVPAPRVRKTIIAAIAAPVPPFGPLGRTGTYAGMINYIEAHSQGLITSDAQGRPIPQLAKELPSLDQGT